MNRTAYLFFLKSVLALLLLSFSNKAFSVGWTAANSGDFGTAQTWGQTLPPPLTGGDNFTIAGKKIITISDDLDIGTLTLNSGCILKIIATKDITITIANLIINDLDIDSESIFDFGFNNVTVTITQSLDGKYNSVITHKPDPGKTHILELRGTSNSLYSFRSFGTTGTSIVRYNRNADQSVFNSDQYLNLELLGSGTKTLNGPSVAGAEAVVQNALTIDGCKLKLNTFNFNYLGPESKLSCTNNGYVYTNDAGTYSSNSSDRMRTFPVGNATTPLALSLSNIANTKVSVGFIPSSTVPNKGIGGWEITPLGQISTKITFLNTGSISGLSPISNIAIFLNNLWTIQPTTFTSPSYTTTNSLILKNVPTQFSLFTCPIFIPNPTILPDALAGNKYSQILDINGGSSPYSIASYTSSPASYKVTTPVGTQDKIKIAGTAPSSSAQSVTVSYVVTDATGCQTSLSNTITTSIQTIWNGSKWSGVIPDGTTPNVRAVIAGTYSTRKYGNITAGDIIIQPTGILTISSGGTINGIDSIKNDGTLIGECGSNTIGTVSGNAAIYREIPILPLTMPAGFVDQPYSQTFAVEGDASPNFGITKFSSSPPDLKFQNNTLTFTPNTAAVLNFEIKYTNSNGTCVTTETRQIKILELPSPNLTILNIGSKTYGDDNFKVRTYSRSTGAITYSIISGNTCADIDAAGIITIKNAGPSPQNIVVVKVSQDSDGVAYKAETATETFIIKPASGKFFVLNYAFLVNENKTINVFTKLDKNPVLTFEQLTGTDIAPVAPDGTVSPLQVGTFSVHISMAATTRYTAFDSIYTFNVITQQKPPVAVADTLVLEMGKDSTFNILENDYGMTTEIAPDKTDIDIENKDIQVKFYSTELGNFLIDTKGNLTILPFAGFIGSGKLGYSVGDANGLRSEIAYVQIIVNPPSVQLEMKANTIMTPNDDNLNDALVIANTDLNKANSLIVQDHSGNIVFETVNYQNNWEGTNTKNNELEPGTYFYIFTEKTSGRQLKNYIQIVK